MLRIYSQPQLFFLLKIGCCVKPLNGWKSMIMYVAFGLHVTFIFPLERGDFSLWISSSQNFEVTNFLQTAECSAENESNVCRGFHIDRQFIVILMDVISILFILRKSFEKPLVKPHFFFWDSRCRCGGRKVMTMSFVFLLAFE